MEIKRFEIVSLLDCIRINDRIAIQITCVDVHNNDIYLGTADSFIFQYANLLPKVEQTTVEKPRYKYLGLKKPIVQIKVASILDKLLCVFDSTLIVLNLNTLEIVNNLKIRNVLGFCVNQNPISMDPFSFEVCVGKKKVISICLLQEDKVTTVKEVSVPEQPVLLAMDGYFVCMASTQNYYMVNWETGHIQLLCSNDTEHFVKPICKFVSRNEFLINGLSHLGVFVKTSGISERPPIDWGSGVQQIGYSYPYILCLKAHSISIFSVIDQKLKETLSFKNGIYIDNFDGKIVVVSSDSLFLLRRIPWEEQINSLLNNEKSQEAIDLCHSLYESGMISSQDIDYAKMIKIKAGIIELKRQNFDLAKQFFIESEFEINILLSCYENISKHLDIQIEDTETSKEILLSSLKEKISTETSNYYLFLEEYIKELKNQKHFMYTNNSYLVNTAFLLVLMEDISRNFVVIQTFFNDNVDYDFHIIENILYDQKHYHLLALCYSSRPDYYEKAIDLFKKLEKGQISDSYYDGVNNLSEIFKKCQNPKIILNHIEFLLERDQNEGASVLIENTKYDGKNFAILEPEFVINMLHKFRKALIIYLEHLIFNMKLKTSQIHTTLAIIYIEIISIQHEIEEEDSTFCENITIKLKNLLETSDCYDKKTVLKILTKNGLDYETALLHGKMGEHKKAFEIYLLKYSDHEQAIKHCIDHGSIENKNNICDTLLSIYLELYQKNGPEIMKHFLSFLNHSKCQFDINNSLKVLPSEWPIDIFHRHLSKSVNNLVNKQYTTSFSKVLHASQLARVKQEKQQIFKKSIRIDKESVCLMCNAKLGESKFVWIPHSECVLHHYCFNNSS